MVCAAQRTSCSAFDVTCTFISALSVAFVACSTAFVCRSFNPLPLFVKRFAEEAELFCAYDSDLYAEWQDFVYRRV